MLKPTGPLLPAGNLTCRELGRADETGFGSAITASCALLIAPHAFRAAGVSDQWTVRGHTLSRELGVLLGVTCWNALFCSTWRILESRKNEESEWTYILRKDHHLRSGPRISTTCQRKLIHALHAILLVSGKIEGARKYGHTLISFMR